MVLAFLAVDPWTLGTLEIVLLDVYLLLGAMKVALVDLEALDARSHVSMV